MPIRLGSRSPGSSSKAASGCLVLFFGLFLVMGLLFTAFLAKELAERIDQGTWIETPCEIESSRVDARDNDYRAVIAYRYTWNGQTHVSDRIEPGYDGSSDYAEAQRLADAYPAGSKAVCRVNPKAPTEALLRTGGLWFGLVLLFPLVFVVIGGGGIWFVLRSRARDTAVGGSTEPISGRAVSGRGARWLPAVFCAAFFLVGLGLFLGLFLPAVVDAIDARNWTPTPCTILSSRVKSHSDSDGTTYSVDILYEYRVGERVYRSNRYGFMGGSSSGYGGKKEIVDRYPKGSTATCYVNPKDPAEAVLERGFTWELLFVLVPLVFMAVGGIGFVVALRSARGGDGAVPWSVPGRRSPVSAGATTGLPGGGAPAPSGPVTLKAGSTPLGGFIGLTIFALFWNGIVSIFVWQAVQAWRKGAPEWFLMVFLVPFVLIGIGVVVGALYQFLALFNPRPVITASASSVPLGGSLDIAWKVPGMDRRIKRLQIRLEGREEATYRRGTTTVTDRRPFASIGLVDARSAYEIRAGRATLRIPPDTMHSFAGRNNKVIWTLKVHGEIDRWPDVTLEFPIAVLPSS